MPNEENDIEQSQPETEPNQEVQSQPEQSPEPQQEAPYWEGDILGERVTLDRNGVDWALQQYASAVQAANEAAQKKQQEPKQEAPTPQPHQNDAVLEKLDALTKRFEDIDKQRQEELQRQRAQQVISEYEREIGESQFFASVKDNQDLVKDAKAFAMFIGARDPNMSARTAVQKAERMFSGLVETANQKFVEKKLTAAGSSQPPSGGGSPSVQPREITVDDYRSGRVDEMAIRMLEEMDANQ